MDAKIFVNIFFDLLKQENLLGENEAISLDYATMIYFLVNHPLYQAQVHNYLAYSKVIKDSKELKKICQQLRANIVGRDTGVFQCQTTQKKSYIYLPSQAARCVCSQPMPGIKPNHDLTSELLAKYPPRVKDKFQLQDFQNNNYVQITFEIESTKMKPEHREKGKDSISVNFKQSAKSSSLSRKEGKNRKEKLVTALANDPRTETLLQGEFAVEKSLEFDRSNLLPDSFPTKALTKVEENNVLTIDWLWTGGKQLNQGLSSNLQSDSIREEKLAEALANNTTSDKWAWFEPARKHLTRVHPTSASEASESAPLTRSNIHNLLN